MARTKSSLSKGQPSPDYPQGKHTVTFTDLEMMSHRLLEIEQSNDPDVIHNTALWYEETIARLITRLEEFEDQISPVYFKRKRAEHAARNKQLNK
jgi:hypothetical protein